MESDEKRVRQAYDYIRSVFFPRWDKMGEWIVELSPNLVMYEDFFAPCSKRFKSNSNLNYKTITLLFIPENEDRLYLVLIHLICDCICGEGHESDWCERMYAASQVAIEIDRPKLFELIWEEVDSWGKWDPKNVYSLIRSAVYERPYASEKSIVYKVAYELRIIPEELKRKYKYWKQIYLWHQAYAQGMEEMKKNMNKN